MVMKAAAKLDSTPETRTISAAEFKAKCLQLMDEVNAHKLKLVVTKRGRPVAEVSAPRGKQTFVPLWGRSPDVKIHGDIISPLPQELTLPEFAWEKKPRPAKKGKKR
jgi:antitoxin (DNA-binding transcriptional repressor) of toxin-antitoxin stability system